MTRSLIVMEWMKVLGVVRVTLALPVELGEQVGLVCSFASALSPVLLSITVFSLHPMFLHRYESLCRPGPLFRGKLRDCLAFGLPYAIGLAYGQAFFRVPVIGRGVGGVSCELDKAETGVPRWALHLLMAAVLVHFALLVFYSVSVFKVIKTKQAFQQSRRQQRLVRETRALMRVAVTQAAGPFLLATPLLPVFVANAAGLRIPAVGLVFLLEVFHLSPVVNALAVLLLLKPYRRVVERLWPCRQGDPVHPLHLSHPQPPARY